MTMETIKEFTIIENPSKIISEQACLRSKEQKCNDHRRLSWKTIRYKKKDSYMITKLKWRLEQMQNKVKVVHNPEKQNIRKCRYHRSLHQPKHCWTYKMCSNCGKDNHLNNVSRSTPKSSTSLVQRDRPIHEIQQRGYESLQKYKLL